MIKFFLSEIADLFVRDNFKKLDTYLQGEAVLRGQFKFFEFTFATAVTAFTIKHGLPFRPIDVITTYKTDGVTVTWLQDSFSATNLKITTSAACTVRAYIGRHEET